MVATTKFYGWGLFKGVTKKLKQGQGESFQNVFVYPITVMYTFKILPSCLLIIS